uniref:Defensin like protein n=1 Tax=Riptortus pedestris TaxID=329032 RepID=R4WHS9_RIPPE|nr:defensin like protein [Riptortus pedestris]
MKCVFLLLGVLVISASCLPQPETEEILEVQFQENGGWCDQWVTQHDGMCNNHCRAHHYKSGYCDKDGVCHCKR